MITSYDKLPLGKYLEIIDLCKDTMDEDDRTIAILSVLTDKSERELVNMPLMEFKALASQMGFLEKEVGIIFSSPSRIKLGGRECVVNTDVTKLTTAQYIDFQTYQKMGEPRLVETMSCFIVPKGCIYGEGYDMKELHEDIRNNLSVSMACSICAFFLGSCENSIKASLTYSKLMARLMPKSNPMREEMLQKAMELEGLLSKNDGGGLTMSTMWQVRYTNRGTMFTG